MVNLKKRHLALVVASLVGHSSLGFAQDSALEEITVTAQKRDASVQDIPIAIEVFNGDRLADSGIEDLDDLTQLSSSFTINTSSVDAQITIRGVGSQNLGAGAYGSTGVYVDGVYYPRPRGLTSSAGKLDGIESLQILKGPQGTIYGRNATGGALVITTRSPVIGEEVNGTASATVGDFGVNQFQGSIYSGLTDTLAGSFNFSVHNGDGFIENNGTGVAGDLDDDDGFKVGGKLVWEANERLKFVASGTYSEDARNSVAFQQVGQFDDDLAAFPGLNNPQTFFAGTLLSVADQFGVGLSPLQQGAVLVASSAVQFSNEVGVTNSNNIAEQAQGLLADGTSLTTGGDIEDNNIDSGSYFESLQVSLASTYSFDTFDAVSTIAYQDFTAETTAEILRADASSIPNFAAVVPGLTPLQAGTLAFITGNGTGIGFAGDSPGESYSSDFYLVSTKSDIEWIAGLYYFYEEGRNQTTAGAFEFDATVALADWEVESIAPYAEVNIPLSNELTLTAGVRHTEEDAEVTDLLPARLAVGAGLGTLDRSDSETTYNLKLAYKPSDDWLLYGGYSTGFKSGSINAGAPENGQVAPEEISSLEFGFKGTAFGGAVSLSGSAFYYEYDNLQLNALNVQNSSIVLIDGAEAEITGLEFDAVANLTGTTTVNFGATLLDHEYVTNALIPATLTGGAEIPLLIAGNDISQTADAVVVASIQQLFSLSNGGDIAFNGSVNYNSGFFIDTRNAFGSGGDEDDSFTVFNTSLKYNHPEDLFSLKLYINNVFDEEYFRGGLEGVGGLSQLATAGRPRHFGATIEYNF